MGIRFRAVQAVFWRNFSAYFSNPAGYVFITIFIVASAFLAFSSSTFFADNLADLSALSEVYHGLLVVFIPAIAMGAWAEERKLGTDELLLTLPVRDIEVVLGKYLAALGVYTVSLVFALSHVFVLAWLGDPDWGLLFANYVGYWILGAALMALALVASSLTSNVTVGFILGTAFCMAVVFSEQVFTLIFGIASGLAEGVGVQAHFKNFKLGVIALPDVAYFALFAAVMLYINMVLIGRRHWRGGRDGPAMGWHYLARGISVIVAAFAVSILVGRWMDRGRLDTTAERLNSLSSETVRLLRELPEDRPVHIQAYVSPEVPKEYVEARRNLLRLLREFDAIAGSRLLVIVHNTQLYSQEARDAEERFGIKPQTVDEITEGRYSRREIFLGLAVSSGPEEEVIKFLDPGLSVEYELTRSVRVVAKAQRRTVGILQTDAKLSGGFEMQAMRSIPPWEIVTELKKQYDVRQVDPGTKIPEDIEVLLAALPSSLTQEELDVVADYIESGRPALLLIDPLPISSPMLSPSQPKRPPQRSPYGQPPVPKKKGDIDSLLRRIGLTWSKDVIVWDTYNPLTKLTDLIPEIVIVGEESGGPDAHFAREEIACKDMERLALMFAGSVQKKPGTPLTVTPLLRTGDSSGTLRWNEIMTTGMFGMTHVRNDRAHFVTGRQHILAARVSGVPAPKTEEKDEATDEKEKEAAKDEEQRSINVVVIADLDMISNSFFNMRRQDWKGLRFDNIPFVLNCVDFLAGDNSLIALRSRRPHYRTLKTIEARRKDFEDKKLAEGKKAEDGAKNELEEAQKRLDQRVEELEAREDIDAKTREIMVYNLKQVETNRFNARKKEIEAKKKERIQSAEQEMRRGIRRIENRVRFWAVILPPLPAIFIGILVFFLQLYGEKSGTPLTRSMRQTR